MAPYNIGQGKTLQREVEVSNIVLCQPVRIATVYQWCWMGAGHVVYIGVMRCQHWARQDNSVLSCECVLAADSECGYLISNNPLHCLTHSLSLYSFVNIRARVRTASILLFECELVSDTTVKLEMIHCLLIF